MKGAIGILLLLLVSVATVAVAQQLPLKPSRTVSFSVDEGTYMNVNASPDGNTLLLCLLGDIYALPAGGGSTRQLTRGLALNLQPVWAPNGKYFACISDYSGDYRVTIRDSAGALYKVLGVKSAAVKQEDKPVWLPDGQSVAVKNKIYHLEGDAVDVVEGVDQFLGFSAAGKCAYYLDSNKLYRYDSVTKQGGGLFAGEKLLDGVVSPDQKWFVYISAANTSNASLKLLDIASGKEKTLIKELYEPNRGYLFQLPPTYFSVSPDSRKVYIGYRGKIHSVAIESGADQQVPFMAKVNVDLAPYNYNKTRITHDAVAVKYFRDVSVSPDGKQLVFATLGKIHNMTLPGTAPKVVAEQPWGQFHPVYSPDGQWIAYVTWSDTAGGALWRVKANGGMPERLSTVYGQYHRPAWSPDGQFIAVMKGKAEFGLGTRDDIGSGQLELLSLKDKSTRVITSGIPLWNRLFFTDKGTRIAFRPMPGSRKEGVITDLMASVDLDGGNKKVLMRGEFLLNLQTALSPDGDFVACSVDEDIYLMQLPRDSAAPVVHSNGHFSGNKLGNGVDPVWITSGKMGWTYSDRFYNTVVNSQAKSTVSTGVIEQMKLAIHAPAFYGKGLIALKNARIITMQGDRVIEKGTVVIENGRISKVGGAQEVKVPTGAKQIDLAGATIIPGFVDVHLHMRLHAEVIPQQSWMFVSNLAYGVTTAREPSLNFDSYGYRELLLTGSMIGPRLFTVGRSVRISDGLISCNNFEEAKSVVQKRVIMGGTEIKQYELPTRMQRQWLGQACRELKANMTNEGAGDPIYQWGLIKDGSTGIEHNPSWGEAYKDIVELISSSKSYLTPTIQATYGGEMGNRYFLYKYWNQPEPKIDHFFADRSKAVFERYRAPKDTLHPAFMVGAKVDARIYKNGGKILLGSHGNDEGIGVHNELWALQMGGLTNMEALQIATIRGAEALGVQQDIGSITTGKIADLIILNKNPLESIFNSREIRYVMKDGILYNGDNLDIIWPFYRKCPEWKMNPQ